MSTDSPGGTPSATDPAPTTAPTAPTDGFDAAAWQQFATDVGLSPQDAKRRLDFARTWEQRAKDNHDAAQRVPDLERNLTEVTARAETAEGRATELEAENLRYRIALEKGLPADLIDRLKGDSEDELKADADKLLALVAPADGGTPRVPRPDPTQGGNGGVPALNSDKLLDTVKAKLGID